MEMSEPTAKFELDHGVIYLISIMNLSFLVKWLASVARICLAAFHSAMLLLGTMSETLPFTEADEASKQTLHR